MSQKITITIDGKDGVVRPDVALKILELVFETLQSIDANTWAVGSKRLNWRVSEASVKNPFALTYQGDLINAEFSAPPDVAELFIRGCERLEDGNKPVGFAHDDIRRMAEIGKHSKQLRALEFRNTQVKHKVAPTALADHANEILEHPDRIFSHGSLEGTLVSLQNYPDKKGATATLLARVKDDKIACQLTPMQADELNDYVDRHTRLVLYGQITHEGGSPARIKVESYRIIDDDDKLPTLADVHALKLGPPQGTSIEDFISEIRGEDD